MNTYILPCYNCDDCSIWIEKVRARTIADAEDKFIHLFVEDYDIEWPSDFDELGTKMSETQEIIIGEIYDIEEF